jgi:hypothetical protein
MKSNTGSEYVKVQVVAKVERWRGDRWVGNHKIVWNYGVNQQFATHTARSEHTIKAVLLE